MTKKDYIAIAAVLNDAVREAYEGKHDGQPLDSIVIRLADYMQSENPRGFNRDQFIKNVWEVKEKTR